MPELPEVETIRRQLKPVLTGRRLLSVEARKPKMVRGRSGALKPIIGKTLRDVTRRGKFMLFSFSGGHGLIIHLKMTGQLILRSRRRMIVGGHPIPNGTEELPNKYSHVIFSFSGGWTLYFNDLRQFGFVEPIALSDVDRYFSERKLGIEPLSSKFTLNRLKDILTRRPNMPVKQLLMDQTLIAGVGNIYATEACFYAQVNPSRPAGTLRPGEIAALYRGVLKVLKDSVALKGTSSKNYRDAYGQRGGYWPRVKVYGRKGDPCPRCRTKIVSKKLAGRGTAYCPGCQR